MKQIVIEVNSLILYLMLLVFVTGLVAVTLTGQVLLLQAIAILAMGFTAWAILSGFWFVLVAIYEELRKLNRKGV